MNKTFYALAIGGILLTIINRTTDPKAMIGDVISIAVTFAMFELLYFYSKGDIGNGTTVGNGKVDK